jgi:hypothetical protein
MPTNPIVTNNPSVYVTQSGDMFDLISFNIWGTEYFADELQYANPSFANIWEFDAGVSLVIPQITLPTIVPNVPPWVIISSTNGGL